MEAWPATCTDQLLVAQDDSICCFARHFLNCYLFCQECLQHASVTDQSTQCGLFWRQHPSLRVTLGIKQDAQLGNPTPEEHFYGRKTTGPKKKTILLWQCCVCANSGIPFAVEACENCGTTRCAYCKVVKVKGKAPLAVDRLEHTDSDLGSDWGDDSGVLGLSGTQNGSLCNYNSN